MSLEKIAIASGIASRGSFDALQGVVEPDSFSEIGRLVHKECERLYKSDGTTSFINKDVIFATLATRHRKSKAAIEDYINSLPEPATPTTIGNLAVHLRRSNLGDQLLVALAKRDDGRTTELMREYLDADKMAVESSVYNGQEFTKFFGKEHRGRLPVCPRAINSKLDGGIPRKSQVGICARPNVGKSTFLANWAATYARNGLKVLYITNEDSAEECAIRIIARLSGDSRTKVEDDPESSRRKAMEIGLGNVYIESLTPGSLSEIRSLVSSIRPDLCIVDQLYPIITAAKSGPTLELANFASGTRQLAREFDCVMVIVTQRDKASGDRLYLKQEDAEWSSTGFAAQLDLMIGLARDDKMERMGRMMVSFPRWKFGPRLSPTELRFDFNVCKVE